MDAGTGQNNRSVEGAVTLRYWAAARAAAGTDTDVVEVDGAWTLDRLTAWARAQHSDSARFADVLGCCAVMVGDRPVSSDDPGAVTVPVGATVEFLPPFAGG